MERMAYLATGSYGFHNSEESDLGSNEVGQTIHSKHVQSGLTKYPASGSHMCESRCDVPEDLFKFIDSVNA